MAITVDSEKWWYSVKEELLNGVQSQNREWKESSEKSREELERLMSIKQLVQSLGLNS